MPSAKCSSSRSTSTASSSVQKVAEIAEGADHHPDITINYTRVTFSCSTHDAGGVTDKDFKLADNIEIAFNDRAE